MSANKAKGDQFERDVVDVLRAHGHPHAERMLRLGAHADRGDIEGIPGFHFDCKNHARHELAEWLDDCKREAPEGTTPVVIVKRRGKTAEQAYVVLTLASFAELISEVSP